MAEEKIHRIRRGAKLENVYSSTDVHFGHIDSAFQSQEYIAQLIRQDPHNVQRIVTPPKQSDEDKGSVDDGCWLYEQLRRLAQDLTYPLIVNLQLECNRDTCPEMKAGEWLYLCVAHGNATGNHVQCCAIDYIVHTLDSATALLNSTRVFPSRLSVPTSSYRHFSSLARRLSRIFAHAFYHHRELFSQAEAESSLYARFLALSRRHDLVPAELLVIPSEAFESGSPGEDGQDPEDRDGRVSPDAGTEANDEGTFMPTESEKDAARRMFEEWTANQGTNYGEQESGEPEPESELEAEVEVEAKEQTRDTTEGNEPIPEPRALDVEEGPTDIPGPENPVLVPEEAQNGKDPQAEPAALETEHTAEQGSAEMSPPEDKADEPETASQKLTEDKERASSPIKDDSSSPTAQEQDHQAKDKPTPEHAA